METAVGVVDRSWTDSLSLGAEIARPADYEFPIAQRGDIGFTLLVGAEHGRGEPVADRRAVWIEQTNTDVAAGILTRVGECDDVTPVKQARHAVGALGSPPSGRFTVNWLATGSPLAT